MDFLPIGSILEKENNKAIILGYNLDVQGEHLVYSYVVGGYPVGYVNNDLAIIPVDADFNTVFVGYKDDQFDRFIYDKQGLYDATKDMTVDEINKCLEEVNEALKKQN